MKRGHKLNEIAELLGRHKSTISRDLSRNTGGHGYRSKQAHRLCQGHGVSSRNARRIDQATHLLVAERLGLQWSPEQIAAFLPISHETIYKYVYMDEAQGGTLYKNLRCQQKKRKSYASGQQRRGRIVDRRPVQARPAFVESRRQVGHWEGDTVIGIGHSRTIVTVAERKNGFTVLGKVIVSECREQVLLNGQINRR
mgnify:CR=1 FL=1